MAYWLIVLALIFADLALLHRVYHSLPILELKRRARDRDHDAMALYKAAAYGRSLEVLLDVLGLAVVIAIIILGVDTSRWLGALVIVLAVLFLRWLPSPKPGGWLWGWAAHQSPAVAKLVGYLNPGLSLLGKIIPSKNPTFIHTGLFERSDLLDLLSRQNKQVDNRISDEELKMARGALTFGSRKVGDVMVPRRQVRFIEQDEAIGPSLMDELHKTGAIRFPVIKGSSKPATPEVVGTLYIQDLLKNLEKPGQVKDIMRRDRHFINEGNNLRQALDAIQKNQNHLLVVVNNFEEVVGVITLETILEQIVGPVADEFEDYGNLKAVAGHNDLPHHEEHHEPVVAPETK